MSECSLLQFQAEMQIPVEDLQEMASLLSLLSSFLHSVSLVESFVNHDSPSFPSITALFRRLDTSYTQICLYSLLESDHHVRSPSRPHS